MATIEYKTDLISQLVLDSPTVSNKHVRVYSIHYDSEIEPLIYAQDISTNGTFWLHNHPKGWREQLIGPGNQVLLSRGDKLRLSHSPGLYLEFRSHARDLLAKHDCVQNIEMRVISFILSTQKIMQLIFDRHLVIFTTLQRVDWELAPKERFYSQPAR